MTASLQPETKSSSRRALLAGALGGIGAWAASAIGRPNRVLGADGETVVVGGEHTATSVTKFSNLTNSDAVLWGESSSSLGVKGSSVSSLGVFGESTNNVGVSGISGSHIGVQGYSATGRGVYGSSSTSYGVHGVTSGAGQAGMVGHGAEDGTGVLGVSGLIAFSAKAKTGVFGYAAQDSGSVGVRGESPAGFGVYGKTSTGYAGFFNGKVYSSQFYELGEVATPAAPVAHKARLFIRDFGGKAQLCVRFHTGAVRVLATEP